MLRALSLRVAQSALVVALVVTGCFTIIRLAPGDPFFTSLDDADVTPEQRAAQRASFGYDRPVPAQFVRYVASVAQGELGFSHSRLEPVADALAATVPNTLLLAGTALVLAFVGGVALGAFQGWRPEHPVARVTEQAGLVLVSIPDFVLALLALMGPALALRWFPVSGMRTEFGPSGLAGVADVAWHLVLPALCIALPVGAVVARLQRGAMRDLRHADFVRTVRAKGATEWRVAVRHALRNALAPVLAYAGVQLAALMGGAVIVEQLFDWPGMGRLLVGAVHARDYPLVAGAVLVGALCTVAGTMLADLARLWADPRQRARP